jgi:hypothetical protein
VAGIRQPRNAHAAHYGMEQTVMIWLIEFIKNLNDGVKLSISTYMTSTSIDALE